MDVLELTRKPYGKIYIIPKHIVWFLGGVNGSSIAIISFHNSGQYSILDVKETPEEIAQLLGRIK